MHSHNDNVLLWSIDFLDTALTENLEQFQLWDTSWREIQQDVGPGLLLRYACLFIGFIEENTLQTAADHISDTAYGGRLSQSTVMVTCLFGCMVRTNCPFLLPALQPCAPGQL